MEDQDQELQIKSTQLEWKIRNVTQMKVNSEATNSSSIPLGTNHTITLALERLSTDCYYICIKTLLPVTSRFVIHWNFSFVDKQGQEQPAERGMETFAMNNHFNTKYIMRLDKNRAIKDLLLEDTLTTRWTFSVDDATKLLLEKQTEESLFLEAESSKLLETLSYDLEKLYENKTKADCVLKADGRAFPVHRAVLSARSSVFKDIFQQRNSECSSGEVNIEDAEAQTLEYVLQYIYSGKIRGLNADTAVPIFTVAEKYAILELRNSSLRFLSHNLTKENIISVADLSNALEDAEILKNAVKAYLDKNVKELANSEGWKTLLVDKPLLLNKYLQRILLPK